MGPSKRIHLERSEAIFFLLVIGLSHAMLFFLGVFTGFKFQPGEKHPVGQTASHEAGDAHHGSRTPAQVEGSTETLSSAEKEEEAGAALKQAFVQSKQQAFLDLFLNKETSVKPESVLSAEAHLNATPQWDRKPASAESDNEPKETEKVAEVPAAPTSVKKLFERKPSAVDFFTPRPGTYTVQVGSYASPEEAQAKVREMRNRGFNEAYIVPVKKAGGDWHRVQFGSFPDAQWAKKSGEKIVKYQLAHGYLIEKVK